MYYAFTKVIWSGGNEDNYIGIELPSTIEGVMQSFKNNPEFNFYKALEIDNINADILALHQSVRAFGQKCSENFAQKSARQMVN